MVVLVGEGGVLVPSSCTTARGCGHLCGCFGLGFSPTHTHLGLKDTSAKKAHNIHTHAGTKSSHQSIHIMRPSLRMDRVSHSTLQLNNSGVLCHAGFSWYVAWLITSHSCCLPMSLLLSVRVPCICNSLPLSHCLQHATCCSLQLSLQGVLVLTLPLLFSTPDITHTHTHSITQFLGLISKGRKK